MARQQIKMSDALMQTAPPVCARFCQIRRILCLVCTHFLLILILLSCGDASDPPSGPMAGEQADYFDGVTYHRFYRYTGLKIGYATSTDGIRFTPYAGNPIMEHSAYPVLAEDGYTLYLIVRDMQTGEYGLYDVTTPTKPLFVRTILRGDYCNVAVSVVDGVWHALIEGHDSDYFFLMYSVMEDGEFRSFLPVLGDAGNPTLSYIPERNAILAFYGADYRGTGTWRIRAAVFDFKTWTDKGVVISRPGVHIADPDLGTGRESRPLIITVGVSQAVIDTYLFYGSKLDLYDFIVSGSFAFESLGVTMEGIP